jgi:hypothetical protein
MLSIIKLDDVKGQPAVKLELPQLKVGDPIALRFRLERQNSGRTEELSVVGRFRVTAVGYDAIDGPRMQLLSVESAGRVPTWVSIKSRKEKPRRLPPARFPGTPI